MGLEIAKSVSRSAQSGKAIQTLAGITSSEDPAVGSVLDYISEPISDAWRREFAATNVIIDFSSAAGTMKSIAIASEHKLPILVGSTGLSDDQEEKVVKASKAIPILRTRNTSVGVNVMAELLSRASKMLGNDFDVELVEMHHKHKTDSPSGTALMLLEHVAEGRGVSLDKVLTSGRSGTDLQRQAEEIGAQAVRGGDVAGEHTVFFFGEGERLEITHRATDRKIFADGAVRGAVWLSQIKRPGLYSMSDVLGRKDD